MDGEINELKNKTLELKNKDKPTINEVENILTIVEKLIEKLKVTLNDNKF